MARITSGSTVLCGKNEAANRLYPVQFSGATGGLDTLTITHKQPLRAYEIEFGLCDSVANAPLVVDWQGSNGDHNPQFLLQSQSTINTVEFNGGAGVTDAMVGIEIRFQDESTVVDLVSIEQSAPGVFEDPRLTLVSP